MAEPSEDDIGNFVSFTGLPREKAILFLKTNNLDLQKAANAYFENPAGVPSEVEPENEWVSFNNPSYSQGAQSLPTFHIEHLDSTPGNDYSAAPSRPPSRMNLDETLTDRKYEENNRDNAGAESSRMNLSAAQLEERDLQQAVAMSLSHQESGVITDTENSRFGPATRDTYDESSWGLTVVNSSAREEIISPDPEDRRRHAEEPTFLRPSQEALHLGGFLTILHSIPLAREALLLREKVIPDYGHDAQWWNGQPILTPRIVSLDNPYAEEKDSDDILCETQRLMAFLDSTRRAFGSADALASLMPGYSYGGDSGVEKFLEAWQEAAVRATPANQLSTIFSSCAMREAVSDMDSSNQREFFVLNTYVDSGQSQTLYDILDDAIWPDVPGEELDDVWLDHVGTDAINVKVPPVFYPDRYMEARRDTVRELRLKRLDVIKTISRLESMAARYKCAESASQAGMSNQELLEKAAQAAIVALSKYLPPGSVGFNSSEVQEVAEQLRGIAGLLRDKLNQLDAAKQEARDTLRDYSKILTNSSTSPEVSPYYKYTLMGICTSPHITYVLRKHNSGDAEEDLIEMEEKRPEEEWQWWRISFSTDDAKTQQAAKPEGQKTRSNKTSNADVIGYTTIKVRETEVLKAARESKSLLLVYANANAAAFPHKPSPSALQEFVNIDNISFQAELDAAARIYHDDKDLRESGDATMDDWPNVDVDDETTPAATDVITPASSSSVHGITPVRMSLEASTIASATIEILEGRLRRLEYLLTGDSQWTGQPSAAPKPESFDDTVARRLNHLETALNSLSKSNPAVRDLLQLYSRFPDLFPATAAAGSDNIPTDLSTQSLASIVLSYATAFPETSSRLASLKDLPIPDPHASTALIELEPRLQTLLQIQEQQATEISELRTRSAQLLQRWYELGILGSSECWAEWESRLEDVEREIKRREVIHDRRAKEI
ncbi:hypothetical protein UA08_00681 [Talaromyces atroroseus]|uniref:UBA domain-containing protein n=1 Tax=Talaromyces atroroseus TaxID=1441469 RepID=A0A225AXJ7_TALAT|nr:hypothetical protein UA08_00681 [Talaromyces atroroseus]OKL64343.1 hypothetical protein UA08_00681 [Talaromyces atroroseus]